MVKGRASIIEVIPKPLRSRIPKPIRSLILARYRVIHEVLADYVEWILGRPGKFTPPRHLVVAAGIGGGVAAYRVYGQKQLRYCIELANLKPHETVLEVGCGIGRLAVQLTKYLNHDARYEAFDIGPVGVAWCQRKITPEYSNFRFHLADVYNRGYNPKGKFKACEYKFPYRKESFDFVFVYSVFTHMIPEDFEHYLSEIARVLKTGGRCIISFLLLNSESLKLIGSGAGAYDMKYKAGPSRFVDWTLPERTISYDEAYVRGVYWKLGLSIIEPVHYGSWPGRRRFLDSQDIVIASKAYGGSGQGGQ